MRKNIDPFGLYPYLVDQSGRRQILNRKFIYRRSKPDDCTVHENGVFRRRTNPNVKVRRRPNIAMYRHGISADNEKVSSRRG
jgi:hypothetical protein